MGRGDRGILCRQRQRGAGLIAVQRAMAGGVEPERALALPYLQRVWGLAGPSAFIAGAARTVILGARRPEIGAEAETFVRQRDRAVRIAFTRCDAVAEAGDENIAHHDFGRDALRRLGPGGDLDRGDGGSAVARPQVDRLGAIESGLLRTFAIVERPGAGGANPDLAGQANPDPAIHQRHVAFLDIIAGAGLADAAGEIDTETVHRIARPAAAVALQFQRLL